MSKHRPISGLTEAYKNGYIKRSWDYCKKCRAVTAIAWLKTHNLLCEECWEKLMVR